MYKYNRDMKILLLVDLQLSSEACAGVANAVLQSDGQCGCPEGLVPVHNVHTQLIQCLSESINLIRSTSCSMYRRTTRASG